MKTTHISKFSKFESRVSKLPSGHSIVIDGFGVVSAYKAKSGRRFSVKSVDGECAMIPAGNYKAMTVIAALRAA